MKMNIFYLSTFILFSFLYSCSTGPANNPRTIYIYQTMQSDMLNNCSRMYENISYIKEFSADKSEPEIQVRAIQSMKDIKIMEQSAGEAIQLIENTKRLLFLQMGENLAIGHKNSICLTKFDNRFPMNPAKYDLSKLKNNETTDLLSPEGSFAKKIQYTIKQVRKVLTETAGFREDRMTHEKLNYFKDPEINSFSSREDLRKQIEKSNGFKHLAQDDQELILRIYEELSFTSEFWRASFDENLSWFEAFGILTSLETKIYNATDYAVTCFRYRYGSCGCIEVADFVPVVIGEERLLPGQNPSFQVQIAGILSHRQPIIKGKDLEVLQVRDGVATVKGDMGKNEKKTFQGTITILNKSGIPKTLQWKKTFYREPN